MKIDRFKLTMELMRQELTQKQLAEISGVSRVTINYIKAGKSCSDEIGKKIAKALKVKVADIIE